MSTIIAVRKAGLIAVTWDTLLTNGSDAVATAVPTQKVISVGANWIGCAGHSVYYNIFEHWSRKSRPRAFQTRADVLDYFLGFARALRQTYHFVNDQSDEDAPSPFADLDAEFMLVNPYGMFVIKEILSITRHEQFCVIGSGSAYAEGSLFSCYGGSTTAEDLARQGMAAALNFDRRSGPPVELQLIKARR